jgi:hypothetical protein
MRLIRFLILTLMLSFGAIAVLSNGSAQAAPIAASSLGAQVAAPSLTEKTRLYCYNRYTGRFLHWGPCGGYRRYYYRPRYYYRRHYYRRYW